MCTSCIREYVIVIDQRRRLSLFVWPFNWITADLCMHVLYTLTLSLSFKHKVCVLLCKAMCDIFFTTRTATSVRLVSTWHILLIMNGNFCGMILFQGKTSAFDWNRISIAIFYCLPDQKKIFSADFLLPLNCNKSYITGALKFKLVILRKNLQILKSSLI